MYEALLVERDDEIKRLKFELDHVQNPWPALKKAFSQSVPDRKESHAKCRADLYFSRLEQSSPADLGDENSLGNFSPLSASIRSAKRMDLQFLEKLQEGSGQQDECADDSIALHLPCNSKFLSNVPCDQRMGWFASLKGQLDSNAQMLRRLYGKIEGKRERWFCSNAVRNSNHSSKTVFKMLIVRCLKLLPTKSFQLVFGHF